MKHGISQLLANSFYKWCKVLPDYIVPLPESGSYRRYFRIRGGGRQVIGAFNKDKPENGAFLYLARHLRATGNNVPEVYYDDPVNNIYLLEDLGDTTLHDYVVATVTEQHNFDEIKKTYFNVIEAMPSLQVDAAEGLDYSKCYPRAEFDAQSIIWDLHYFKYSLLKPLRIEFFEQDLEDDFNIIVAYLCNAERKSFMFRDFQSRNIMLHKQDLYFIDFQGGRKGPLQYDLASLLFEAKTDLPPAIREEILHYYLKVFAERFNWFREDEFLRYYYGFVYLRLMQAMGAYGFRGLTEHKPLFLQSLPGAVKIVSWLESNHPLPLKLKCLPEVFASLAESRRIPEFTPHYEGLTVTLRSFSYRNGIPPDTSPDGGGFVFDCRSINNPGRVDDFKNMTGLEEPVKEFLRNQPDADVFFSHTCSLVENAVKNYLSRNFRNLSVSYGCTGGQHRSVYMTEKLADFLRKKYDVRIIIKHTAIDTNT